MSALASTPSAASISAPATGARAEGFFSFHGPWAPGVRLFRRLRFRSKAALISMCFLVPLLLAVVPLHLQVAASVDALRLESRGLRLLADSTVLVEALSDMRNAARARPVYPGAMALSSKSHASLRENHARWDTELRSLGDTVVPAAMLADLRQAIESLPADADGKAVEAVLAKLMAVRGRVNEGSGAILDPDAADLQLVLAYTVELPDVAEAMGQLRGWGTAGLGSAAADPKAAARVMAWAARAADHLENFEAWLQRSAEVDPGVRATAGKPPVEAVHALLKRQAEIYTDTATRAAADPARWWDDVSQALHALHAHKSQALHALAARVEGRARRAQAQRVTLTVAGTLALALAGYLFWSFYLVMEGGLREVRRHLRAMTEGDLTTRPVPWGNDEAARLMVALRETQESLQRIVVDVRASATGLLQSSTEIAEGALDLSSRTERTAANLEQTAASMEQMSGTVKNTADHAGNAERVASQNAQLATEGGQVMLQMVATMKEVAASSSQIGEIIGTIEGIAFQTNILALNAAVEAARAGDAGRGFAVVASEVRALAQRSSQAAREIKALVEASIAQTRNGSAVVGKAQTAIEHVLKGAQEVGGLIAAIAAGAREQALGVQQVGDAAQELDRTTQQNAALVEETAAAASTLKDGAHHLADRVARFKLPSDVEADTARHIGGAREARAPRPPSTSRSSNRT